MIILLWQKWREEGHLKWIALVLAVLVLDAFVGSTIIAWEIEAIKNMWK